MSHYTISEIWIYPIKSLPGIRLEEAQVEAKGLRYDRRWMLVDNNGKCLTQRTCLRLAFFDVQLGEKGLVVTDRLSVSGESCFIPYLPDREDWVPVQVWDSTFTAQLVSDAVSQWFSILLGFGVRLVCMGEHSHRKVNEKYALKGEEVSFADGYPILLISQASLDNLNERLSVPVKMHRFRPNLIVSGASPFEEDTWRDIQVGEVGMKLVKPCSRCVMVTIDPETGEKSPEPLKTLSLFRKMGHKVMFGQNILVQTEGGIRVGDPLIVH